MPMSSPQMTTMFGFFWAVADSEIVKQLRINDQRKALLMTFPLEISVEVRKVVCTNACQRSLVY